MEALRKALEVAAARLQDARATKNQMQRQAKVEWPNQPQKVTDYCRPWVEAWNRALTKYDEASLALHNAEKASNREQVISTALEELRIDMLINVGLCCKEEYADYLGRIINSQFSELKRNLNLPVHTSDTANKFAQAYGIAPIVDAKDEDEK